LLGLDGMHLMNLQSKIIIYNLSILVSDDNNINFENILQVQNSNTDNRLLFILNNLNLSLTHFCQLSFNYINKYENYDHAFINEYTKRYRSYVDTAMYLNDYLENLNVLVNCVYDVNEQIYTTLPKFSVMRFMMTTWNREVFGKLDGVYSDRLANISEIYFNKEFMKLNNFNTSDIIFSKKETDSLEDINDCGELSFISFSNKNSQLLRNSTSTNNTTADSFNENSCDSKQLSKLLEM
jgi:hypothetical protein